MLVYRHALGAITGLTQPLLIAVLGLLVALVALRGRRTDATRSDENIIEESDEVTRQLEPEADAAGQSTATAPGWLSAEEPDQAELFAQAFTALKLFGDRAWSKAQGTPTDMPAELVLRIMRAAQYGKLVTRTITKADGPVSTYENQDVVFAAVPVPRGARITSIRIEAKARDQGWSSYPNGGISWTWGELAWAEHDDDPLQGPGPNQRVKVFENINNIDDWQPHDKLLEEQDSLFLRIVSAREMHQERPLYLLLMMRSQHPCWHHKIERAEITVTWDCIQD